jgi:hypothetical protein
LTAPGSFETALIFAFGHPAQQMLRLLRLAW